MIHPGIPIPVHSVIVSLKKNRRRINVNVSASSQLFTLLTKYPETAAILIKPAPSLTPHQAKLLQKQNFRCGCRRGGADKDSDRDGK